MLQKKDDFKSENCETKILGKEFSFGKSRKTKFIWPEIGKVSKITISNLIATINLNVDFKMKFDWKSIVRIKSNVQT